MTEAKIKRVEFLNVEDKGNRKVRVTLSDEAQIVIVPLWGGFQQTGGLNEQYLRTVYLAHSCVGYLGGDDRESLSWGEVSDAETCFENDCVWPEMDEDIFAQARMDFITHMASFEVWEARA